MGSATGGRLASGVTVGKVLLELNISAMLARKLLNASPISAKGDAEAFFPSAKEDPSSTVSAGGFKRAYIFFWKELSQITPTPDINTTRDKVNIVLRMWWGWL
ncbi:MAG: hypothetical protein AAB561_01935 [Patescibacteria group bacterium]